MNNSRKTWKQAFAEVNAMHLEALRKQEEILMKTLFNRECSNLFIKEVSFEYNGTWITDQYLDETGRFEVDPVEYYKESYIKGLKRLI